MHSIDLCSSICRSSFFFSTKLSKKKGKKKKKKFFAKWISIKTRFLLVNSKVLPRIKFVYIKRTNLTVVELISKKVQMSNKSIVLGNFLPQSLLQSSTTSIRRLTSTSEDSEDSGVDSVDLHLVLFFEHCPMNFSRIDKNERSLLAVFHHLLDLKN